MTMTSSPSTDTCVRRRRRGDELENAILDSAWDELLESGFATMTMESVAARAQTGVAVLYRRWANKSELAIAAIERYGRTHPVDLPDTGNLRDDLIATLESFSSERASFTVVMTATFAGLLADSGLTPAEVREKVISRGRRRWPVEIFERAQERGEIDLEALTPSVLALPFDLMRHDMLMTLKPIPSERIVAIIDEIFMPLVSVTRQDGHGHRMTDRSPATAPNA
jgi:AcrR family transcriptional regulator